MSAIHIDLLGVRGSTPAPGAEFVRYGGHTSCVALSVGDEQPDLVLDAGTGIRDLGALLHRPFDGAVLLTHLHWDHTQGLPFSDALLHPGASVGIVVPVAGSSGPLDVVLPWLSPPAFPVAADELTDTWRFLAASLVQQFGGWVVRSAPIRHKGGLTLGYRVERDGTSVVYMPDHDLREPDPGALELAAGADVLLHDAQYTGEEIERYRDFGHSTIARARGFAAEAGVRGLVLTHHAPNRTDAELDAISSGLTDAQGPDVVVARQGARLEVATIAFPVDATTPRSSPVPWPPPIGARLQ